MIGVPPDMTPQIARKSAAQPRRWANASRGPATAHLRAGPVFCVSPKVFFRESGPPSGRSASLGGEADPGAESPGPRADIEAIKITVAGERLLTASGRVPHPLGRHQHCRTKLVPSRFRKHTYTLYRRAQTPPRACRPIDPTYRCCRPASDQRGGPEGCWGLCLCPAQPGSVR